MNLSLGDTVTMNILGRDITGTISSFREVDFSSVGIGFILSMNPSALQGAPHTFISTVYAEPEVGTAILRDLAKAYPNITAIRVHDAIERVADVLSGLAAATSYGASATLLTGFLVLIGAAAAGTKARTYEAAVLKTLGATRGRILLSFALRSALLGLAAGLVALAAGIAGGWAVSTFVMNIEYIVIWPSALAIIAGVLLQHLLLVFCSHGAHWRRAQPKCFGPENKDKTMSDPHFLAMAASSTRRPTFTPTRKKRLYRDGAVHGYAMAVMAPSS